MSKMKRTLEIQIILLKSNIESKKEEFKNRLGRASKEANIRLLMLEENGYISTGLTQYATTVDELAAEIRILCETLSVFEKIVSIED